MQKIYTPTVYKKKVKKKIKVVMWCGNIPSTNKKVKLFSSRSKNVGVCNAIY